MWFLSSHICSIDFVIAIRDSKNVVCFFMLIDIFHQSITPLFQNSSLYSLN